MHAEAVAAAALVVYDGVVVYAFIVALTGIAVHARTCRVHRGFAVNMCNVECGNAVVSAKLCGITGIVVYARFLARACAISAVRSYF